MKTAQNAQIKKHRCVISNERGGGIGQRESDYGLNLKTPSIDQSTSILQWKKKKRGDSKKLTRTEQDK